MVPHYRKNSVTHFLKIKYCYYIHLGFRHSYLSMFENFPAQNFSEKLQRRTRVRNTMLKFFRALVRALGSMVKWLLITIWVILTLFFFGVMALLLTGVASELLQFLYRSVT